MIRDELLKLQALGAMPSEQSVIGKDIAIIKAYQTLLEVITGDVTPDEIRILVGLFGEYEDSFFGLKWAIVHLIEDCPEWPLMECIPDIENEWIQTLRIRLKNAGQLD